MSGPIDRYGLTNRPITDLPEGTPVEGQALTPYYDSLNKVMMVVDPTTLGAGGTGTISNNAVTNAKLADVATATVKGRNTAGTGDPEDLTMAQLADLVQSSLEITESQVTDLGSYVTSSQTWATSAITSGTFADARIAESNVTQHEGAISITESQISDLGSYVSTSTKLDDFGSPDDNTDLNATTSAHGLRAKLTNKADQFQDEQGSVTTPARYVQVPALAGALPASNAATADADGGDDSGMVFGDSADSSALYYVQVPEGCASTFTTEARLETSGTASASEEIALDVSAKQDDEASLGTAISASVTVTAASTMHAITSGTVTPSGSPAAGDWIWVQITRDVSDESTSSDGDVILKGFTLTFDLA